MKLKLPFHWSWIIIIVGLWVGVNQTSSVIRLYRSGDRMKEAKTQLDQLESQKTGLQKKLAGIDNSEYIESELRDKLGYGRPGETILILPKVSSDSAGATQIVKPEEPNWKQWWDLYIRI